MRKTDGFSVVLKICEQEENKNETGLDGAGDRAIHGPDARTICVFSVSDERKNEDLESHLWVVPVLNCAKVIEHEVCDFLAGRIMWQNAVIDTGKYESRIFVRIYDSTWCMRRNYFQTTTNPRTGFRPTPGKTVVYWFSRNTSIGVNWEDKGGVTTTKKKIWKGNASLKIGKN